MVLFSAFFGLYFEKYVPLDRAIKSWFGMIWLAALIFVVGFRFNVGHDYDAYNVLFSTIHALDTYASFDHFMSHASIHHGEIGFDFLIALLKVVGVSFNGFLCVITALNIWGVYAASRYFKVSFFQAFFIFFCLYFVYYFFSYLRISLVAVGFLCALRFVVERKFLYYLASMIGLSLLHELASILVLVYFFRMKVSYFNALVIGLGAVILMEIGVLRLVNPLLEIYYPLPGLGHYLRHRVTFDSGILTLTPVVHCLLYFSNLYIFQKYFVNDRVMETLMRVHLLCIASMIAFSELTILAGRLSGVLAIVLVILAPKVLSRLRGRILKVSYCSVFFGYLTAFFYKMIFLDPNYMLPYTSVL